MGLTTRRDGSRTTRAGRGPPRLRASLLAFVALVVLVSGGGPSAGGATQQDVGDGVVAQVGVTANLSATPNPAHPGEAIALDARGSASADSTVETCEFDVDGDGNVDATEETCLVEWTYRAVGDYPATVRVRAASGETATATTDVVVRANRAPRPVIGIEPTDPRAGEQVTLSATDSADPDGRIVRSAWRLPDRTFEGEAAQVRFPEPGAYEVTLAVTDDDGLANETTATVRVRENRPPTVSLSVATAEPRAGEPLGLDASAARDPDGRVVEYRWDLDGDGVVDRATASPEATLVADRAGSRRAAVTVVDDAGATATDAVEFAVEPASPGATRSAARTDARGRSATESAGGPLAALDFGVAPVLPDWLALLLAVAAVAAAVAVRRHGPTLRDWVEGLRARLGRGDVRRRLAKKASGAATKTAAKRVLRALADGIEGGGRGVGNALERVGRAIERWSARVAAALRRLAG